MMLRTMCISSLIPVIGLASPASWGEVQPDQKQQVRYSVTQALDRTVGGVTYSVEDYAAHAPGQLIVKYRSSELIQTLSDIARFGSGPQLPPVAADVEKLHNQYRVRTAKPLFADIAARPGISAQSTFSARYAAARLDGIFLLTLDETMDVRAAAQAFNALPDVEYAHPNFKMELHATPDDPFYSSAGSWGQAEDDLWGMKIIQANDAWDHTQGEGVVVAVVDTGLDTHHPDMAANVWQNPGEIPNNGIDDDGNGFVDDTMGWDFVNHDNIPEDDVGHGTHVAGTVAAVGNNGIGVIGVAPMTQIMPVKGFSLYEGGTIDVLASSLLYAMANGADIINNSWGCSLCFRSPLLDDVVRLAHEMGVVTVFASGNSNIDLSEVINGSSASVAQTIAVGASDPFDAKVNFSSPGLLDVVAPGGSSIDFENIGNDPVIESFRNILSLFPTDIEPFFPELLVDNIYAREAGTSMSAPHVSGAAALIKALHPNYTVEQIRQALRVGADDIAAPGVDRGTGFGRLNAAQSLTVPPPLEALITLPIDPTSVIPRPRRADRHLEISGIANGANMTGWTLEVGQGREPEHWTPIAQGDQSVANGVLTSWDTADAVQGDHTLRLTVTDDTGRQYLDHESVYLTRASIAAPSTNVFEDPLSEFYFAMHKGGDAIPILGTAASPGFERYEIVISGQDNPLTEAPVLIVENDGLQPVYGDQVLAIWDTSNVTKGGRYTVQLNVFANGEVLSDVETIIVDPTLETGWPRDFGLDPLSPKPPIGNPLVADIDQDGDNDMVITFDRYINVYDDDGEPLAGWPQSLDPDALGAVSLSTANLIDVIGDHRPELIAHNSAGQVFIFNTDGTLARQWTTGSVGALYALAVADVNRDGRMELVATSMSGDVSVMDIDGKTLPGWPRSIGTDLGHPALGDLDGDGLLEIVAIDYAVPMTAYALRLDGSMVDGWPVAFHNEQTISFLYSPQPSLADLNLDGTDEIAIGDYQGNMHILDGDGTPLPGWPQQTNGFAMNSAAIADLNGDGRLNIIAADTGFDVFASEFFDSDSYPRVYAWNSDGTLLAGWPAETHFPVLVPGYSEPVIADVDGDRRLDVVVGGMSDDLNSGTLHAFDHQGSPITNGFPKLLRIFSIPKNNAPTVANMDSDHFMELALVDALGHIYMWNLASSANQHAPWPMYRQNTGQTGSLPAGLSFVNWNPDNAHITKGSTTPFEFSVVNDTGMRLDEYRVSYRVPRRGLRVSDIHTMPSADTRVKVSSEMLTIVWTDIEPGERLNATVNLTGKTEGDYRVKPLTIHYTTADGNRIAGDGSTIEIRVLPKKPRRDADPNQ